MSRELAEHESRRLALDFVAQRLLFLEDTPGRRAHGAVIEVRVFGIEQPVLPHSVTECSHSADSNAPAAGDARMMAPCPHSRTNPTHLVYTRVAESECSRAVW